MVVPAIANNLTVEPLYLRPPASHCIYPSPIIPQKLSIYTKFAMDSRHTGNLSVGKSNLFSDDGTGVDQAVRRDPCRHGPSEERGGKVSFHLLPEEFMKNK